MIAKHVAVLGLSALVLGTSVHAFGTPSYQFVGLPLPDGFTGSIWPHVNVNGQVSYSASKTDPATQINTFYGMLWQNGVVTVSPVGNPYDFIAGSSGSIGGEIIGANQSMSPFLYNNGQLTPLSKMGHETAWVKAVDSQGRAIGEVFNGLRFNTTAQMVRWSPGGSGELLPLSSAYSDAWGANDNGDIAFTNQSGAVIYHSNGQITPLIPNPGESIVASGLNSRLDVAGMVVRPSLPNHASIWTNGQQSELDSDQLVESNALAINDSRQVIGFAIPNNAQDAYLWQDMTSYDLNDFIPADSGWHLSRATMINNDGWIVGDATYQGQYRSFLLIPTPEPASAFLFASMIGWTFVRRRRGNLRLK